MAGGQGKHGTVPGFDVLSSLLQDFKPQQVLTSRPPQGKCYRSDFAFPVIVVTNHQQLQALGSFYSVFLETLVFGIIIPPFFPLQSASASLAFHTPSLGETPY